MKNPIKVTALVLLSSIFALWFATKGTALFFPRHWFEVNWLLLKNPDDKDALYRRWRLQESVNDYSGAMKTLEKIIGLYPQEGFAYERIGRIHKLRDKLELSLQYYQKAESLYCAESDTTSQMECRSVKIDIDYLATEMRSVEQ